MKELKLKLKIKKELKLMIEIGLGHYLTLGALFLLLELLEFF